MELAAGAEPTSSGLARVRETPPGSPYRFFKRYSALSSASGCDGPAVVAAFPGVEDAVIY